MSIDPSAVKLRPATPEDTAVVAEIWYAGWGESHIGHIPDELVAVRTRESFDVRALAHVANTVVATIGDAIAGFVMIVADEVEQIYVSSEHRGSGVAAVLLAEAERRIAASGHAQAWLAVVAGNPRACRFYARSGWVDEGPFDYMASSASGPIRVPCHRYVKRVAE